LTNLPPCDRIRSCVNLDDDQRSASYSERRHGFGYGVSGASITHRWRAQSPSSCGGRMLQATNYVPAHAVLVAGKGATLQHPGWAGNHIGFYPFPMSIADENA
jgi:hypothetical protein